MWYRNKQLETVSKIVLSLWSDKPTSTYNDTEWFERPRPLESICFKRKASSFLPVLMEHFHSLAPVTTRHLELSEFRAPRLWNEHAESNIQLTFLARAKPHCKSALSRTDSFLGKKRQSNSESHTFKIIKHFLWS